MDLRARVAQEFEARGGRGAGWHMTRLAAEMGVARAVLHRWVSGQKPWPEARKAQLAAVFGLDQSELFEEV